MPVIPLEVIGVIIDFLVRDNWDGTFHAKACSLTCKSVLPLCRKHIFRSVHMRFFDLEKQSKWDHMENFGHLLFQAPENAIYVHHLKVYWPRQKTFTSPPNLSQVVKHFTNLKTLAIWGRAHASESDWRNLVSPFQDFLLNLMHLPTITGLNLRRIKNFLISDLIPCTRLDWLTVDRVDTLDEDSIHTPPTNPIQLEAFHIGTSIETAQKFKEARRSDGQPVLDLTKLQKISVGVCQKNHVDFVQQLFKNTQRLTEVKLGISDSDSEVDLQVMGFAQMIIPSLQTLRQIHFKTTVVYHDDALSGLCDALEEIVWRNVLASLIIDIEILEYDDWGEVQEWGRLETVLLKPGWPKLNYVSLAILLHHRVPEEYGSFDKTLEELPETYFSGLSSSESINFNFSSEAVCAGWND